MVIGHGDIASVLPERDDLLFFASGVSNSQETRLTEYQREVDLVLDQPSDAHIVYFSSLAIFYSDTQYTQHKRYMEVLIKENFPIYTIIRLGNITFGTNPNTVVNYFRNQLDVGAEPEVRDEYRFLVGKDEFLFWVNLIPSSSCEMNITGRRVKPVDIVKEIKEGKL